MANYLNSNGSECVVLDSSLYGCKVRLVQRYDENWEPFIDIYEDSTMRCLKSIDGYEMSDYDHDELQDIVDLMY